MIETFASMGYPSLQPVADGEPRPFWSVVIPTIGRLDYIMQAIESVYDQRTESMEILIVVSGGNCVQPPPNIRCISFPDDLGAIRNWNRAISQTRGHWIHLLHDDDYVLPGFYASLEPTLKFMSKIWRHDDAKGNENHLDLSIGAACTAYQNRDNAGNVLFEKKLFQTHGAIDPKLWQTMIGAGNHLNPPAVVIARSTYEKIGLYDPDLTYCADWELYCRAAVACNWWYSPIVSAVYRIHDGQGKVDPVGKFRDVRRSIDLRKRYFPEAINKACCLQWFQNACQEAIAHARQDNTQLAWRILHQARLFLEASER